MLPVLKIIISVSNSVRQEIKLKKFVLPERGLNED